MGAVRERSNDPVSYVLNLAGSLNIKTGKKQREFSLSWTAYRGIEMEFEQRTRFLASPEDDTLFWEILDGKAA